jgi:hypothetical protein
MRALRCYLWHISLLLAENGTDAEMDNPRPLEALAPYQILMFEV